MGFDFISMLLYIFILLLFKILKEMGSCQSADKKDLPLIQEVYESKKPGFSPIYRKSGAFQLQYSPIPNIKSVAQLLNYSFDKHPNKPAIGYIKVEKARDEQGQQIQKRTISNLTSSQIKDMSLKLTQSIMSRKFGFTQPVHKMNLIGIYSKNRFQWLLTDIACIFMAITTVPLYDTLGFQNLSYCLKQTQLTSLFVSADTLKTLLTLKDFGNLRNIISFDLLDQETVKKIAQLQMNLVYFKDLLQQGATIKPNTYPMAKPSLDTCLTFSYTSGTTGPPKGAMLSHRNILSFIRGIAQHPNVGIKQDDVYASYLPLPHVMQRAVVLGLIGLSASVICTSGDVLKLKDDCQAIKPTLFLSVPRIYNRIVQAVKAKFQGQTGFKKWLIEKGVNSKLESIQSTGDLSSTFYDSMIFSKVRQSFGGRIRVMASGSAPMNPQSRTFIQILMSCPFLEGYGSTQTSGGILYTLASTQGQYSFLCDIAQLKLSSIPQMNYTAEDVDANGANSPRGEIWIRGHPVFMGYYKLQQITKETITSDGWVKTGDVGQYFPHSKAFKIIDRKKNIFKLQQGEYIAPDKVQNVYLKSRLLAQVFIHGQSTENFVLLIAVPNKDALLQFAKSKNIEGSYETVSKDKKLRSLVLAELNKMAKAEGLNSLQQAKNIYFQLQNFTVRNIMTNTSKLIRYQAKKYYKAQIQSMYKEGDIVGSDKK